MDQKKQGQQNQGGAKPRDTQNSGNQFDREPAEGSRDDMINQGNRDDTNRGSRRERQSDR